MTAPIFKNGEWLCPEDHAAEELKRDRVGLGGSNFKGTREMFERVGGAPIGPRFLGGDRVDPSQAVNRKVMLNEFMNLVNDPTNDEVDGINHPKVPESGRRGAPFMIGGRRFENPTPSTTIEQLPDDLRQLLLDWAHEQDRWRNDSRMHAPQEPEKPEPQADERPSAPGEGFTGSVDGAAPHDPLGNLMRLPADAWPKLLHPKKRYFTNSNYYETSGDQEYPQNVQQKQSAKQIAETLLTKEDERAHGLFKSSIERNFDERIENYIRNTRWKTGVDGFPEYPTPIKDYLTHRFLAIDATQPVVVNHHQHIFTKNEFEHHHHTERAPHGGVSPEQAFRLIMGLKDTKNRGASLFEEARQRAEKYIVDESNVKGAAVRPMSPTVQKMLSEVNEPHSNNAYDYAAGSQDKKVQELQQIIRAQQEEIARLRAALENASEIPAAPMGVSSKSEEAETEDANASQAAPAPAPPTFDYEWSRKHWPFQY